MTYELKQFIRALDVFVEKHEVAGTLAVAASCFFVSMAIFGIVVYIGC